ncbi:YlxR family protein [Nocardioides cynanchi]|uniref:YlxR family protein n=1 Tax=Nocardioides cynanchi TaxID=2558918 RepID=UPI002352D8E8|nr:YlxR family protein [Nocardioides cynanchi]
MVRATIPPAVTAPSGPVRTCIGCRERAAKSELLRVTAGSDASGRPAVVPDPAATRPGRGAHLHPTTVCYDLAVRRRAFGRALRATVGLDSAPVASYLASLDTPTDR